MSKEKKLKEEIFKKVEEFYKLKHLNKKFIPGATLINYAGRVFDANEIINLVDASLDFWLTAGRFASEFEEKLSDFLGLKYCILTNSGSSANLLAVSALTSDKLGSKKINAGDEIITTGCGFPTTLNPIIQNNLTPVIVDVEIGSYNAKIEDIERAISKKTKAIFLAHTLGNPVNVDKIIKIVEKHNLWFIEDNCDALGSKFNNVYTGNFGHLSTCSFYPAHHITTGEGGAILTNDQELKKILLSFRDWGRDCYCETGKDNTCGKRFSQQFGELPFGYDHKYVYSHIGYNLKLTDLQAAIGIEQLKKLPKFIEIRKNNYNYLYENLKKYQNFIVLPKSLPNTEVNWFGFPILIKDDAPFNRGDIISCLEKAKIATRMLFGGNLLKQPAYKKINYRIVNELSNTDLVMNNLFWIGVYPGLSKEELGYIIRQFDIFFRTFKL